MKPLKKEGLGEIKVGAFGDFTVFSVDDVDVELPDCNFNMLHLTKMINPITTIVSKTEETNIYPVMFGNPTKENGK